MNWNRERWAKDKVSCMYAHMLHKHRLNFNSEKWLYESLGHALFCLFCVFFEYRCLLLYCFVCIGKANNFIACFVGLDVICSKKMQRLPHFRNKNITYDAAKIWKFNISAASTYVVGKHRFGFPVEFLGGSNFQSPTVHTKLICVCYMENNILCLVEPPYILRTFTDHRIREGFSNDNNTCFSAQLICRYVYFCIRVTYIHGIYKHLILFFFNVKCLRICSLFLCISHPLTVCSQKKSIVGSLPVFSFHILVSGIIIARKMLNSFLFGLVRYMPVYFITRPLISSA